MSWKRRVANGITAVAGALRSGAAPRQGFRVLMYHAIGSEVPDDRLRLFGMDPAHFAEHVACLAHSGIAVRPIMGPDPGAQTGIAITFDDGFRDVLSRAAPLLCAHGLAFTVFATGQFIMRGDPRYLSAPELRELAAMPAASIGAHGWSHARLTECDDRRLNEELVAGRSYLEDLLGRAVTSLSYPHGAVDTRVRDAAAAAGYTLGAGSVFGINRAGADVMRLKRTSVWRGDTVKILRAKLRGDWDWYGLRDALRTGW